MYCILTHACTFFLFVWNGTVERLRSFGDESRLENLRGPRAEEVQEKSRKKQPEESAALKQSEVSL